MKDVHSHVRVCPVRIFCGEGGGVLQMRTSTLFGAKHIGFF